MIARLAAAAALALLAGCATVTDRPPVSDVNAAFRARQADLAALNRWDLHGRVALRSESEGWNASLVWWRRSDRHRIDLAGPLGSGRVRLKQDADGAELRDSEQNVLHDSSAEALLARATGWQLPVNGLNYWVLGLPAPGSPNSVALDPWGRPATLEQQGWQVEYLDYAKFSGRELPSRLFLKRRSDAPAVAPDAPATLEVRLVIERWVFGD